MSTDAPDDRPTAEQTPEAPEPRPEPAGGASRAGAGVRTGVAKLGWTRREPGSRRFPRITRSIARPEGGGGPPPGTRPRPPGSGRCCWCSRWWGWG
ncbi:hypothetical protein GA0115250_11997 [Streptomyces sp. BvitLS-983]|nr:hypothetical protein GA0115250_11997 [Streptomyces sp. BvitLS-983]